MQVYFMVNMGRKLTQAGVHLIDGVPLTVVLLNAGFTV